MPNPNQDAKIKRQLAETKSKLRRALPPDPDDRNDRRAEWANAAVTTYRKFTEADRELGLCLLLGDLMHLCDRDRRYGRFDDALAFAEQQYLEETKDYFN